LKSGSEGEKGILKGISQGKKYLELKTSHITEAV
jgi:hypothetical protein